MKPLRPPERPTYIRMMSCSVTLPLAAEVIPADLPAPDDKPTAKDKPVKVFILSGQSNMLGFGKVEGSNAMYSSVFLSADPSVTASKIPVENSALMPLKLITLMKLEP